MPKRLNEGASLSEQDLLPTKLLRIVAYVSFGIIAVVVVFAILSSLTQRLDIVGYNLVNVEWPPSNLFPLYLKPITWLYMGALAFMYSELELNKDKISKYMISEKGIQFLAAYYSFEDFAQSFGLRL